MEGRMYGRTSETGFIRSTLRSRPTKERFALRRLMITEALLPVTAHNDVFIPSILLPSTHVLFKLSNLS